MKAFKEYGVASIFQEYEEGFDQEKPDDSADELDIVTIEDEGVTLPFHLRCVSHTLSLISTKDASKVTDSKYKKTSHSTFAKCSALWNASRRPKSGEKVVEKLGRQLTVPCVTRWNSMYESVAVLLEKQDSLNVLMLELKLPIFDQTDFTFLSEYVKVMRPIADALNKLQGEHQVHFGSVLPTLLAVQSKLKSLEEEKLHVCKPLLTQTLTGLKSRFGNLLNLELDPICKMAVVASTSNPKFRLRWLTINPDFNNPETKDKVIEVFREALKTVAPENLEQREEQITNEDDSFFEFQTSKINEPKETLPQDVEMLRYLSETSTELNSLLKYPTVKEIFIRLNTPLPSSAPVERLFSLAGNVYAPKRNRLSDAMFQNLVLMKANKSLAK